MNQDKQPEALRLADDLDASNKFPGNSKSCNTHASAELRRLHARVQALEQQRAELLEALKAAQKKGIRWHPADPVVQQINEAITKAEAAE